MPYEGPGIYLHYKGGHYRVLGVAKHESDETKVVVYQSFDIAHEMSRWMEGADFVCRPLNAEDGADPFNSFVSVSEPRFRRIR